MRFGIRTLDDISVNGKTVLCRLDINQPIDRETGLLRDTTRIRACIPTVRELSDKGARLVLLAHQGSDIEYNNFYTTEPHAKALSAFLGKEVRFVEDVCGPYARSAISALNNGEILLLDNVRFVSEEQTLFEMKLKLSHERQAQTLLVRKLAPLADLYVCDAFAAAHRDQPSLCGFEQTLPSAMGRLFEAEYCAVSSLMEAPERPCAFVLGGAKISDAFLMMDTVLRSGAADSILAGGLAGHVLLWASGAEIGDSARELIRAQGCEKLVEAAKTLLSEYGGKIVTPKDFGYVENGARRECAVGELPEGAAPLDIGVETAEMYREAVMSAKTVFVNGPMGVFEENATALGTDIVWSALGNTSAHTVIGGGDSVAAASKFGVTDKIDYICTGGGALIRFLSGEELPVVKALRHGSLIQEKQR